MGRAVKIENLSKIYRLGEIGTGTLSYDLHRWWAKIRGKEDPFLKIGETNDRTSNGKSDLVYSLRDINFEIKQGDTVGVIGKNGAGKSTLLKILSRVTSPTTGSISVRGRVASLLEVGTGFHPELTGRENIYLNGAILGMRKKEISRKLEEIIEFSGVSRYIDTPVKRYSSGMYVRLAFAVAAHLESEILIVDEVLAVGDAEFQKKCLGKMGEVSKNDGRTILFVSHNLAAIRSLTSKSIFLKNGCLEFFGETTQTLDLYNQFLSKKDEKNKIEGSGEHSKLLSIKLFDKQGRETSNYVSGNPMIVEVEIETDGTDGLSWELFLCDMITQTKIAVFSLYQLEERKIPNKAGIYKYVARFNSMWIATGNYYFDFSTSIINTSWDHVVENVLSFEVLFFNQDSDNSWDFKASSGFGNFAITCEDLKCEVVSDPKKDATIPI